MSRTETVFIVGAGASAEFGLPVGSELIKQIVAGLSYEIEFDKVISKNYRLFDAIKSSSNNCGFLDYKKYNSFLSSVKHMVSALPESISIDNFIYQQENIYTTELGKMAIVQSILDSEGRSSLAYKRGLDGGLKIDFSKSRESWLAAICKLLSQDTTISNIDCFFDGVKIICFNYDRCIEHYFYNWIKNNYNIHDDVVVRVMKKLQIIHVYGSVGGMEWQENDNFPAPFGAELSGGHIHDRVNIIYTFTEIFDTKKLKNSIDMYISESERIVFLGFGFHQQNMDLLRQHNECKISSVLYTSYLMSDPDKMAVEFQIGDIFPVDKKYIDKIKILIFLVSVGK